MMDGGATAANISSRSPGSQVINRQVTLLLNYIFFHYLPPFSLFLFNSPTLSDSACCLTLWVWVWVCGCVSGEGVMCYDILSHPVCIHSLSLIRKPCQACCVSD